MNPVACEAVSARRGEPAPRSEGGALEATLALEVRRSISRSTRRCSLSAFSTEREMWLMRLSSPAAWCEGQSSQVKSSQVPATSFFLPKACLLRMHVLPERKMCAPRQLVMRDLLRKSGKPFHTDPGAILMMT